MDRRGEGHGRRRHLLIIDAAPSPEDLRGATAVARTLAYAVGVAGIVASAAYYADGGGTIVVATVIVFTVAIAGLLMIAAFLLQAMTSLLARMAAIEQDVRTLLGRDQRRDW